MPRPVEADVADGLERETLVADFDALDRALGGADDVVVDDQALEREAQQAGVHAGRLVDHVGAGIADQRVVQGLLGAGLAVRQLRIGHARGGAAGQVVEVRHLARRGREQRLLGAAARHGARAQVGDEAPGAEDGRVSRLDRVDVDEPGQHLGHFLRQRAGQRGRSGGAGLAGRQQQHGHAAAHRHFEALAGVGGELHRRHDEAVGLAHERPLAPLLLAAGDHVQHLQRGFDMLGLHPAAADMLGRRGDGGVAGVEVHLERVGDVARHDRALEEMDVLHDVDDAADVEQVLDRRFAVAGARIDHVDRRAGRAEVRALAPGLEVVARVLAMQHEMPAGLGQRVLDQRRREQQAAIPVLHAAGTREDLDTGFRCIGQADFGQQAQRRAMDLLHVRPGVSGWYRPDSIPGRTGRRWAGRGPARSARRAVST